jgi:hypothetical protein
MTPKAAKADPAPLPPSSLPADVVDASVLDALIEKTKVERQLEAFRTKALEKKEKVAAAVSARVLGDYDTRLRALRAEAEPLRARARTEWEKLRALYAAVASREERARLEKQELEFRHEVGEIDETALNDRIKTSIAALDACGADVAALDRHKARFLEVFTEQDLAAAPALARPVAAPAPAEQLEADVADAAMTMEMPAPPRTVTSAGPARPQDERSGRAAAPTIAAAAVATDAAMPGPMPDLSDAADDEGTLILPEGAIVVLGADGKNTSHRLSAMCYIGRSDENQIRIQGEGVSRRHALIVAERNGFRIENLGSQNGVLVNGKPMQRGMLSPGDVITLGVVKLRFEQPGTARR